MYFIFITPCITDVCHPKSSVKMTNMSGILSTLTVAIMISALLTSTVHSMFTNF